MPQVYMPASEGEAEAVWGRSPARQAFSAFPPTAILCLPGTHTHGLFQDPAGVPASMKPFLTESFNGSHEALSRYLA